MSMVMGDSKRIQRQTAIAWLFNKWLAEYEAEKCLDWSPNGLDPKPRQKMTVLKV